jgi:hypothetical protein
MVGRVPTTCIRAVKSGLDFLEMYCSLSGLPQRLASHQPYRTSAPK